MWVWKPWWVKWKEINCEREMTPGRVVTEESTEWCWGQGGIQQGDLCTGSREEDAWDQVPLPKGVGLETQTAAGGWSVSRLLQRE